MTLFGNFDLKQQLWLDVKIARMSLCRSNLRGGLVFMPLLVVREQTVVSHSMRSFRVATSYRGLSQLEANTKQLGLQSWDQGYPHRLCLFNYSNGGDSRRSTKRPRAATSLTVNQTTRPRGLALLEVGPRPVLSPFSPAVRACPSVENSALRKEGIRWRDRHRGEG